MITMNAMRAVQNMFVKLESIGQVSILNEFFVPTLNACIQKVLEVQLIERGFSTYSHDAINDIVQYCDNQGLR